MFVADKDRDELKDTLARIVSREKERATQSRQSLVDIVTRLGDAGKLPQHHADVLVDIVNTGHQVRDQTRPPSPRTMGAKRASSCLCVAVCLLGSNDLCAAPPLRCSSRSWWRRRWRCT